MRRTHSRGVAAHLLAGFEDEMTDYAQTTPEPQHATAASRRTTARQATLSPAGHLADDDLEAQTAAMNGTPQAQTIAQLQRALNQSPRAVQLARMSAVLQKRSGSFATAQPPPLESARPAAAIQRKITVGKDTYEKDDKKLLALIAGQVKGQLSTWADRTTINNKDVSEPLAKLKELSALTTAVGDLFADKYDEGRIFTDIDDLRRQTEQDIILGVVGLPALQGTEQQLDQYHQSSAKGPRGPGAGRHPFRIYRCMKRQYWDAYQKSGNVKDILHGHGGGLGQALDYFRKSVADKKTLDDVLVEFRFPELSEAQMIDPEEIGKGGEGKAPKGGKLGGKSEKNDIFAPVAAIYSVNLQASKDLIASKKPEVKALAFSRDDNPGEAQAAAAAVGRTDAPAGPLSPTDVMVRLKRRKPGDLAKLSGQDWIEHGKFTEEHPEFEYSYD